MGQVMKMYAHKYGTMGQGIENICKQSVINYIYSNLLKKLLQKNMLLKNVLFLKLC